MNATTREAFDSAKAEGLCFFWATMHTGTTTQFLGQSWEDGGFYTNENGDPARDHKGNTVASFAVEFLDRANAVHVAQCEEWFNG